MNETENAGDCPYCFSFNVLEAKKLESKYPTGNKFYYWYKCTKCEKSWNAKQLFDFEVDHPVCPICDKVMSLRKGPYGEFFGCSGYPKCKHLMQIEDVYGKKYKGKTYKEVRSARQREALGLNTMVLSSEKKHPNVKTLKRQTKTPKNKTLKTLKTPKTPKSKMPKNKTLKKNYFKTIKNIIKTDRG